VNGTRIIWRIILWLVGILTVILFPAVIVMMIQIVFASWFTIVIFAVVVIGFPLAAHIENKR
jgi:hypothetical protein